VRRVAFDLRACGTWPGVRRAGRQGRAAAPTPGPAFGSRSLADIKEPDAIPAVITPDLASHVVTYATPGDDGLVFTSPEGAPLRRSNFIRRAWRPALRAAGLPMIHFHDLRHTGNRFQCGRQPA